MSSKVLTLDDLSPADRKMLMEARATGDLSEMTERYFVSPQGYTRWYHDGEAVGHFRHLLDYTRLKSVWEMSGRPETMTVQVRDRDLEIWCEPDPQDFSIPSFYLKHGYLFFDWAKPFVSRDTNVAMAIASSGLGKTSAVGLAALCYAVLYPGFKFFNLGPSDKQSQLMSQEIDTWLAESEFQAFLRKTTAGKLHVTKPTNQYVVLSPFNTAYPSTLTFQTIGQDAENIIGYQGDWINLEEFIYIIGLATAMPRIVSRFRAMRPDGTPRWFKLTMIANPGDSPEKDEIEKRIAKIIEDDDPQVRGVIIKNIPSSANLYNTKRQLRVQFAMMDSIDARMWLDGEADAAVGTREFPQTLLDKCRDADMDTEIRENGKWGARKKPSVGLVYYSIPRELNHEYVVVGDPGMSDPERRSTPNVPVVGVFDITDFPNKEVRLVMLDIIDGGGKYEPWIRSFKNAMIAYACHGFYDSTNVQTAFEDEHGSLRGWPVKGLQFNVSTKPWSITILKRLMESGMMAFPMIETLWYQARIYVAQGQQSKKNADDVMAMLLVFCLMILDQQALWVKLRNRLTITEPEPADPQHVKTDPTYVRYERPIRSRYAYERRAR